jgi:O-antigen/teichoic acid export membrane protein
MSTLIVNLAAIALLTPDQFGRFAAFQAAGLLGFAVWDLGVSPLLTREVAAGRIAGDGIVREVARLRAFTLAPAVAVVAVGVATVEGSLGALAAASAYMVAFGTQLVIQSALRGNFRFRDAAASTLGGRVGLLASFLLVLRFAPADHLVEFVLLSLAVGEAVTSVLALWQLKSSKVSAAGQAAGHVLTFRRAAPFAATSLLQVSYNRLDVVLIAAISSTTVVGYYGLASRLQDLMYLVPNMVSVVLLPYASRLYTAGAGGAKETFSLWARLTVAAVGVSVVGAAIISSLAPAWIPHLFGTQYEGSVVPVQVIVWSVPLITFNLGLAAVVSGRHKAHYVSFGMLGALGAVVVTDIFLVPLLGATGAAIGATVRELPLAAVLIVGASASGLFGRVARPTKRQFRGILVPRRGSRR